MRFFLLVGAVIGALVFISLRVVHERNRGVNIGFSIQKKTDQIRQQHELIYQLRIERAALLDPKVLRPAAQKLGLRSATPDEVVPMPVEIAHGL